MRRTWNGETLAAYFSVLINRILWPAILAKCGLRCNAIRRLVERLVAAAAFKSLSHKALQDLGSPILFIYIVDKRQF
jgi:hypothetical protein